MDTAMMTTWDDESIAELVATTMHYHHDIKTMCFENHARHIVAALRANGLLADAALDVDAVRAALDKLEADARQALGERFHFTTLTVWGSSHRKRHAAIGVTLHIADAGTKSFPAGSSVEAIADATRWLADHSPAAGWATLGATVAP